MNTKLMVELLKRGKNGNEIIKILDAITSDAVKLPANVQEMVVNRDYSLTEPVAF